MFDPGQVRGDFSDPELVVAISAEVEGQHRPHHPVLAVLCTQHGATLVPEAAVRVDALVPRTLTDAALGTEL